MKTTIDTLREIAIGSRDNRTGLREHEDLGRGTDYTLGSDVGATRYDHATKLRDVERMDLAVAEGLATVKQYQAGRRWKLTDAGKARLTQARARDAARVQRIKAGGFDPEKPISEMTSAEIEAFIAWRDAQ